jgi:hypothetical protein
MTVPTFVSVIWGKNAVLKDVQLHVLPRVGEFVRVDKWRYKVLKIEHSLSTNPDCHTVKIFIR